jgi:hypothetical protein
VCRRTTLAGLSLATIEASVGWFGNDVGFRVRSALRWSAPVVRWRRGSWDRVLAGLDEAGGTRARQLRERHQMQGWDVLLDDRQWQENLYVLDLLERHVPGARGPGLEVGAKNGAILPALHATVPGPWDLVELDAHRRYLDLTTRRARGERIACAYDGSRFIAGSVTELDGSYGLVVWFLPFVFEEPLQAWGLPRRFFAPESLLAHVAARVAPGGTLFVVNQGPRERDRQRALFAELGLAAKDLGPMTSALSPFRRERFGFLWRA